MTQPADDGRTPAERAQDVASITRALRQAVREALAQHKRSGNPVAIWSDGRVEWVAPQDIPDGSEPDED